MNRLDVQLVNSQSPYKVEEADDENFFEFFTEHDVHYSVGFMPDDSLMQSEAYHLIIVNVDNRPHQVTSLKIPGKSFLLVK